MHFSYIHFTCQQKLQSCQLSNIKQITEDEGLFEKLLWKEPWPLLTLDGDAFCAGFTHLLSLLCTLWLKIKRRPDVINVSVSEDSPLRLQATLEKHYCNNLIVRNAKMAECLCLHSISPGS